MPCRSSQGGSKVERRELAQADPLPVLWHPGTCLTTFGPSGSPRYCAARQPAPSPIPCLLLPCLSRALLSCARLQGERDPERETERQEGCHGKPATRALIDPQSNSREPLLAGARPPCKLQQATYLKVHCVFGRIESTTVEIQRPASSIQHPASSLSGLQPTPTSHSPNLQNSQPAPPAGRPPWLDTPDRDLDVDLDLGLTYQPSCLPDFVSTEPRSNGATGDSSVVIFSSVLPNLQPRTARDFSRQHHAAPSQILRAPSALCNQLPWPSCTCTASLCRPQPPLQFEPRAAAAFFDPATIAHTVMADSTA